MNLPARKSSPTQNTEFVQTRIADRLAELWQRQRPEFAARVEVLERAAAAVADARLTPEMQLEAAALAHKLAGALGMYGEQRAGDAARKMEWMLEGSTPLNGTELQRCAAELRHVVTL